MRFPWRRELARWRQEWDRKRRPASADQPDHEESALPWLDRLRWWVLPLLLGIITLAAWWQLATLTQPASQPYVPLILDAPLPDPLSWRLSKSTQGRYFLLRSRGLEGRFVALQPGPGTRAFQGKDAVALFGQGQPNAELIPSLCQASPAPDDVRFFTGDGMALWFCQHPQDNSRFELRRLGWRFSTRRWQGELTLGRRNNNDIVLGAAMLPSKALRLKMVGRRLHVRPAKTLPQDQRMVCFHKLPALPQDDAPSKDTTQDVKASAISKEDPQKDAKQDSPPKHTKASPAAQDCSSAPLFLEPGERFQVYAKHHLAYAVKLMWQPVTQEKGHHDLWLSPMNGPGVSVRHFSTRRLLRDDKQGFLIGNAEAYFNSLQPDAVRTHDLEDVVHDLVLRRFLVYLDPNALKQTLSARYRGVVSLEELAKQNENTAHEHQLKALNNNRYLRNRIWMANRSLARNYKLQARTLFRIRFGNQSRPGELLGLGLGSSTLRAPTRHLVKIRREQRKQERDLRLRTVLQAKEAGSPYLQPLDEEGQPDTTSLLLLDTQKPTEVLASNGSLPALGKRSFHLHPISTAPRAAIWAKGALYTSYHPFAYKPQASAPVAAAKGPVMPKEFLYTIKRRWWKRSPGLQRSSLDWPIEALSERLGTLLTRDQLVQAISARNPKRLRKGKHCGNQSKRVSKKWKHGRACWGEATLLRKGTSILVPCSALVRTKIKETYCKPGQPTPKVDKEGRAMLPALRNTMGLYGVVLLPKVEQPSGRLIHTVRQLPGSPLVHLNEQPLPTQATIPLRDGHTLRLGTKTFLYRQPTQTLALARFRGEYITPHYPEGPVFSHVLAGSVGGPFRSTSKELSKHVPLANQEGDPKGSDGPIQRASTTLAMDLQRVAFSVSRRHFARMDSAAFQKQFRRRYIKNIHKPHAGAVVIVDRRTGKVLTSLSFPAFDPNLPKLQSQVSEDRRNYRYLRGQLVDQYGITDTLLAYNPSRLPPAPPKRKRLEGKPKQVPNYLEALGWDREEELRGVRGDARSGWLLERALRGAQTPGSTAKLVTAIAYARYLRARGKPVRFPKHTCSGGMMFMRERRLTKSKRSWRPSRIRFRCHKRAGHGHVGLVSALASSCNVYFAKLALEMAGASPALLRKGEVRWMRNRYGSSGKYQFLRIPGRTLSEAMHKHPHHRALFETASKLGFAMRYTYRADKRKYARYTDVFWQPGQPPWPQADLSTDKGRKAQREVIDKRLRTALPDGFFGIGPYFGRSAAYPAWQQWVHQATDPRYGKPMAVQRAFGSTDASLRAMAYIGFGQSLIVTPLRMALVAATLTNGGWLPAPRLWEGPLPKRPAPRRIINAADALSIRKAMAAVTQYGTAGRPFAALNKQCLQAYGLEVIGKTGTAETSSQKARATLLKRVVAAGTTHKLPAKRKWFRESGCTGRRFWKHYYPEENIADSLFVGAIAPKDAKSSQTPPQGKGWRVQDLAFAVVVKNGYHPEGKVCRRKGRDLDRAEAKYLAHDILLAALQHIGICRDYKDSSQPTPRLQTPPKRQRRTRRRGRKRRNKRKRRSKKRKRRSSRSKRKRTRRRKSRKKRKKRRKKRR